MGSFIKGDVVVINFPFTDLISKKKRPALVVTKLRGDDVILIPITSIHHTDEDAIPLQPSDFRTGGLPDASSIRPNILFTAQSNLILERKGKIQKQKIAEILDKIISIIKS